jgi:hypothetical protein
MKPKRAQRTSHKLTRTRQRHGTQCTPHKLTRNRQPEGDVWRTSGLPRGSAPQNSTSTTVDSDGCQPSSSSLSLMSWGGGGGGGVVIVVLLAFRNVSANDRRQRSHNLTLRRTAVRRQLVLAGDGANQPLSRHQISNQSKQHMGRGTFFVD